MNIWDTSRVLTAGIVEREVETTHTGNMVCFVSNGGFNYLHGEGRNWHRTLESAKKFAEAMRKAKIASLKKHLAKLEAMTF